MYEGAGLRLSSGMLSSDVLSSAAIIVHVKNGNTRERIITVGITVGIDGSSISFYNSIVKFMYAYLCIDSIGFISYNYVLVLSIII